LDDSESGSLGVDFMRDLLRRLDETRTVHLPAHRDGSMREARLRWVP
jgi:hypothetical protein